MMKRLVLLITLVMANNAQAQPFNMDDFAYGIPLQVDGDGAIYSLPLPIEVYRRTLHADLGDMRIFNGHGEVVPHMLQREPQTLQQQPQRIEAKLYPLPALPDKPSDEEVHVATGEGDTLIDFYAGRLPLEGAGSGEYYLLDASEVAADVGHLHLEWDEVNEPLFAQVTVHGSDDLNHWQLLVEKRTVASLQHQGIALLKQSLELPLRKMKYYRIHWPPGSKGVTLQRVEFSLRAQRERQVGDKLHIQPHSTHSQKGVYEFTLDGHYPVSRVGLVMPHSNTVVRARLLSRADEAQAWQLRHQGLFYDLQREGHKLRSEPVPLTLLRHPHWRLEVVSNGGGLGSGVPQLEVEWQPDRLLFIARGEMPFTLAFGRSGAAADKTVMDPMLRRIDTDQARFIKSAQAGQWFELGGESRLRPLPGALPWQKWLLWGGGGDSRCTCTGSGVAFS